MTNWNRIFFISLFLFFLILLIQPEVDCRRSKSEKIKERQLYEEKRNLKKEGKKIKKNFSKKYEQFYLSLCADCFIKMNLASENCVQSYDKLNLSNDKINKCKDKSKEKSFKKKKNIDNSIDENINLKGWKDVFEKENKFLDCLFDELKDQENYRFMSKEEFKKEKNSLTNRLLQEKIDCMKKYIQSNSTITP